jgi:uncharacterized GH25 family protein
MNISDRFSVQPKRYVLGNTIYVRAKLLDRLGVPVNPATVRLLYQGPSDTESTAVASTVEDDDYAVFEFTPDAAGTWRYRVETFGSPIYAAEERSVIVLARMVAVPA